MNGILIDTNVLLDLFAQDPSWFAWSASAIAAAANLSRLIINPVIYAEVSVRFATVGDLDTALPTSAFIREPIPFGAAFLAGKVFVDYRRRGGTKHAPLADFSSAPTRQSPTIR